MFLKLCVLAGSSKGNSIFIRIDEQSFLVDAGISVRRIEKTLKEIKETNISALEGILVSHEHTDHVKGIKTLSRKYNLKCWLTYETYQKIRSKTGPIDTEFIEIAEPFWIGEVKVLPFEISHDATNPIGYILSKDDLKVGVLLDCGTVTPYLLDGFRNLDVLIIEANHSFDKLLGSEYPDYLKERILSSKGHLSNWDTGNFLLSTKPKLALLTHLSEQNNSVNSVIGEIEEIFALHKANQMPYLVIVPPDRRSSIIYLDKK